MKKDPAILHLNLHREFFAAIAAGTKKTEYRARTPHWRSRLEGRRYDVIKFRNGYATRAPEMLVEFAGLRRQGRGAKALYAIRLGRILKLNPLALLSPRSNQTYPVAFRVKFGQVLKQPARSGIAPFHKPNRCWTRGRVMGESTGSHGILLGALPVVGGARNIRQAYGQPAASTRAWNWRGRRSNPSTLRASPEERGVRA
jgi:hypothetical protein